MRYLFLLKLATYPSEIDKLVDQGGFLIMVLHNIVPVTSATENISIADFEALTAYIVSKGIRTYRPSEVYDLLAR